MAATGAATGAAVTEAGCGGSGSTYGAANNFNSAFGGSGGCGGVGEWVECRRRYGL